jgi:hypothetical protein
MEQLAIVARLKPGAEPDAAELVANGLRLSLGRPGWSATPSSWLPTRSSSSSKAVRSNGSSTASWTSRSSGSSWLHWRHGGRSWPSILGSRVPATPGRGVREATRAAQCATSDDNVIGRRSEHAHALRIQGAGYKQGHRARTQCSRCGRLASCRSDDEEAALHRSTAGNHSYARASAGCCKGRVETVPSGGRAAASEQSEMK